MDDCAVLRHLKEMISEIIISPRWDSPNEPKSGAITPIGDRVNSAELMQRLREKEDYNLLFDTVDEFEKYLNDDWMPFTIIGLELEQSRCFLKRLYDEFDHIQKGNWTQAIQRIYQETKQLGSSSKDIKNKGFEK